MKTTFSSLYSLCMHRSAPQNRIEKSGFSARAMLGRRRRIAFSGARALLGRRAEAEAGGECAAVTMFTTGGHRLITHFSFQNHSTVYTADFVCVMLNS